MANITGKHKYEKEIQKIYIAYYQRPADPEGLIYWNEKLEKANGNLKEIIEAFANSEESKALYGNKTVEEVLKEIYQSAFNRDLDSEGLKFYTEKINSGEYSLTDVMLRVLDGATGTDEWTLKTKIDVANQFTKMIDPDLDGKDWQYEYKGEKITQAVRDWFKTVDKGMIQIDITKKLDEVKEKIAIAKGETILEEWGGDTLIDAMQDLPLALSGAIHLWKEGIWGIGIGKELELIKDRELPIYGNTYVHFYLDTNPLTFSYSNPQYGNASSYMDTDTNIVTMEFDNLQTGSRMDMNGKTLQYSLNPYDTKKFFKDIIIKINDYFEFKNKDKSIEFHLENTKAEFKSDYYYDVKSLTWDINSPWNYKGKVNIQDLSSEIQLSYLNINDTDAFKFSNVSGDVTNGYSYSMFDANLTGTVEVNNQIYSFRTENLTVNSFKDYDKNQYFDNMIVEGSIILIDEEGNELKFNYYANNPYSTDDDYGMVVYDNFYVEQFDLIL